MPPEDGGGGGLIRTESEVQALQAEDARAKEKLAVGVFIVFWPVGSLWFVLVLGIKVGVGFLSGER